MPPDCLCSAQMNRRAKLSDSYWCAVLCDVTVGTTPKIHSACFCCLDLPELKLIIIDSDETGLRLGCQGVPIKANHPYDNCSSHVHIREKPPSLNSFLTYVYSIEARITVEGSLLQTKFEYFVPHDSVWLLILEDFIKCRLWGEKTE